MKTQHEGFSYQLQILEQHLDSFGHVNNAMYATLFEQARWELITQNGYGLKTVQALGVGPVILEMNIKFIKEILLRETITITIASEDPRLKISTIHQKMFKQSGELAAEGRFTIGLFDLKARKLVAPTLEWIRAIDSNIT